MSVLVKHLLLNMTHVFMAELCWSVFFLTFGLQLQDINYHLNLYVHKE